MGKRKMTTIRIDEELLRKAHELGLNVSKVCENALKEAVRRLEGSEPSENPKKCSNDPQKLVLVARERFELSSAGPKPAMLVRYTTGLQDCNRIFSLKGCLLLI